MKKRIVFVTGFLFIGTLCFHGCAGPQKEKSSSEKIMDFATALPDKEEKTEEFPVSYAEDAIMYSNLTDDASKKEVSHVLQEHGISEGQTVELMEWADDFNKRVHSSLAKGFQKMTEPEVDYSRIIYDPREMKDGSYLPEANCRLTSFLLMKDLIRTNGKKDDTDTYLMFDVEAIETAEQFQGHRKKLANYCSLYNWISVNKLTTLEQHEEAVKKAWKDREIQVDTSKGVSLINVYIHSIFENVRIVGHTGVLFDMDGKLLFVEKYGPEAPIQAIWFHNRRELKKYLLVRKDLYGDKQELAPIIMENDQIMKTE